jgi:hypothetical protein
VDQLCHTESGAPHPHECEGIAHERAQVVYCQVVYCVVVMTSCRGDLRRKAAAPGRVDEAAKEVGRIQARQHRPLIRHVFEHVEAQDAVEAAIRQRDMRGIAHEIRSAGVGAMELDEAFTPTAA